MSPEHQGTTVHDLPISEYPQLFPRVGSPTIPGQFASWALGPYHTQTTFRWGAHVLHLHQVPESFQLASNEIFPVWMFIVLTKQLTSLVIFMLQSMNILYGAQHLP